MPLKFIAEGGDGLASFEIHIPGYCNACSHQTDVSLRYHAPQLKASLAKKNIDPKTPSLIVVVNKKFAEIGVTCGCYAKFHRQLAHIGDSRKRRDNG